MKDNDVNEIIYVEEDRTKSRSKNELNLISKNEYNNVKEKKKKKDQQNHTRHYSESRIHYDDNACLSSLSSHSFRNSTKKLTYDVDNMNR